ncbi:MAG: glycosyltransferase family 4 protein [Victivallaceae bacterium]|nr:glycosyltransferase family 4 protein [Victivallaceae bacterium]
MDIDKTPANKIELVISWSGIPAYGARLIRAGIEKLGRPVTVIGTNPQIAVKDTEDILGQKIIWIDDTGVSSWAELNLPVPDIFFQGGWNLPSFNKLGKEVITRGGKVIVLSDNNWKNSFRQWLAFVKFRLFMRKWFSAVWVPGLSAVRLMRFMGMPPAKIYKGLYGSDHACFSPGPPLSEREKQFIFVGQFIPRKEISTLVKAFKEFHKKFPDWELLMYGAGECRHLLENIPNLTVHPFADSRTIGEAFRQSRFLVLPSWEDHWPLVVSEAACVGCGLILSNKIGNRHDLSNEKNGFIFKAGSSEQLAGKMEEAALFSDARLNEVYEASRRFGAQFGLPQWGEKFCRIVNDFRPSAEGHSK